MNEPIISVIVPVYNAEQYLDECIESISNQTYRNLEIILINDGSSDSSGKICDSWAEKDKRIKVLHQSNRGQSAARNRGLDIAGGEYIGFVDSDDYISPQMYDKLLDAIIKNNKKVSYCIPYLVTPDRKTEIPQIKTNNNLNNCKEMLDAIFYGRVSTAVWDKLYKKDVFKEIRFPEGETNEEYPLLIPLSIRADGMAFAGEGFYFYRMRENSTTSSEWKTDMDIVLKNLKRMEEQLAQTDIKNTDSFRIFSGRSAFSIALHIDKNYKRVNCNAKNNQKEYIKIMRKNLLAILSSKHISLKDKILYIMVLARILIPVYKVFYRNHIN